MNSLKEANLVPFQPTIMKDKKSTPRSSFSNIFQTIDDEDITTSISSNANRELCTELDRSRKVSKNSENFEQNFLFLSPKPNLSFQNSRTSKSNFSNSKETNFDSEPLNFEIEIDGLSAIKESKQSEIGLNVSLANPSKISSEDFN